MTAICDLDDLTGQPLANVFPESGPKRIRLALDAGDSVAPHSHPGRTIVFHVIAGAIELRLDDMVDQLDAGEIARFDGEAEIQPTALEAADLDVAYENVEQCGCGGHVTRVHV